MTQEQVLAMIGAPFGKTADVRDAVTVEKWVYKETTWDQG
jgi:hypothetical protein